MKKNCPWKFSYVGKDNKYMQDLGFEPRTPSKDERKNWLRKLKERDKGNKDR